jgi:hypothetical protein
MPTNGYEIALEHATIEIDVINAQIEKLTHRKGLIDKLIDCLRELVPESEPLVGSSPARHAPALESFAHEAHAHHGHEHESYPHESTTSEHQEVPA